MNADSTVPDPEASSPSRVATHWMLRAVLGWFFLYMILQGQDGFFARTIDRVEPSWLQLVFLNIPLQAFLALLSASLYSPDMPRASRLALVLASVNCALVLGHVVLSVMYR